MIQRVAPTAPEPEDGVAIKLAGREYILPAIYIGPLRRLGKKLAAAEAAGDQDAIFEASCALIHASLSRNYPDVTLEDVEERMVTVANLQTVLQAALGQSGVERVPVGEGAALGEATGPS